MYLCAIQFPQKTEKYRVATKTPASQRRRRRRWKYSAAATLSHSRFIARQNVWHSQRLSSCVPAIVWNAEGAKKKKPEIPQWLNMVVGCQNSRQKESDSGNITQGDKQVSKTAQRIFSSFIGESRQLTTCNCSASRVNKEAMCVCK